MKNRLLIFALLCGTMVAQDITPASGGKAFVYTGVLASIPATCTTGTLAFITNATAGQNIYECSSTNTWTQQIAGSGAPANGGTGTGQVEFNNGGAFGGIVNSLVDNNVDSSASNRTMLVLSQTWTAGAAGNSEHVLDLNCTSQGATAVNTLACGYFTLMNKNTAGANGHPIGLALRFSDNSTGSATIGLSMDGLYVEANNAAGTTGVGTIPEVNDINLANATLSSTSQTISVFNGVKYTSPIMGANTVITKEIAANLGAIRSTTAQVVTSHLINAGGCTDASVYLAAVLCGGRVDIQSSLLMSGATMGAASAVPQTLTQPYIIKISAFHDTTSDVTVNLLTTSGNAASGTGVGLKHLYDVGGSSGNMTLVDSSELGYSSSGAATATRANALSILGPTGSGVITTGVGVDVKAQKAGGVSTGYAFWSEGTADFNRFDGQVGIHKIPTTTSTLAIAGLPTSSAGLVSGDVWANSNVLTIIP